MSTTGPPRESLFDAHGRKHDYLRISLTDRCNFRCQYCMPEEGVDLKDRKEILTFEEIVRLTKIFAQLGVTKVRLTGGEPTIRKGLLELVRALKNIVGIDQLHLTTNGASLSKIAAPLFNAGLTGVNVSVDSLQPEKFFRITRRDSLESVLAGIESSISSGLQTKINVVVLPGLNDDELIDFVEFVQHRPVQVRFIEFMPFVGNLWKPEKVLSYQDMRRVLDQKFQLKPLPNVPSDVAREFYVDGFTGTIGFVSSVSESFCGGCNRLRLTADGLFKTCLFLPGRKSLRDLVRSGASDGEIVQTIREELLTKWAAHPSMDTWRNLEPLSMVQIGG